MYELLLSNMTIRLITLDPGFGCDPIVCYLFQSEFGTHEHEVLAYGWGQPGLDDLKIFLNEKKVRVRRSTVCEMLYGIYAY